MARIILCVLGIIVFSAVSTYLFFVWIYRPKDQDFLVATTSYYFKSMSENEAPTAARFGDCRVASAGPEERAQGVSRIGLCGSQDAIFEYHYSIALSDTARYLYSDLEKTPK